MLLKRSYVIKYFHFVLPIDFRILDACSAFFFLISAVQILPTIDSEVVKRVLHKMHSLLRLMFIPFVLLSITLLSLCVQTGHLILFSLIKIFSGDPDIILVLMIMTLPMQGFAYQAPVLHHRSLQRTKNTRVGIPLFILCSSWA